MSIQLFKHNSDAYRAAVLLMSETGKAAIIHPTGTGKSFIAFKLCEDNPDKRICWLSPSEYIFKTQIENLQKTGAEAPRNIRFFTYAKLMYLSAEEMREIQPDFIILDEFHRCGAEMWGRSVGTLLEMYPNVPLLGLSATNIRYLDNQRDMADELFDGNVASSMTLGEAIVRGILLPPKYVLSVFGYQKNLEKYQRRIKSAKSKAVRDTAEIQLQKLRRALENADGLDVVFEKHMEDKHGKYIVFCSNIEHMHAMRKLAPEWFSRVDKNAHIYFTYSDNPEADRQFAEFKADTSEHLRLLYCVDMLNEGVHVDDINGVILLRPTVSPIIYEQQIGRAFSAGKKNNAVIFDVVLNIENLYSIGTIENEMQTAVSYYRENNMEYEIVSEHFNVVDEVRDCIQIFNALTETLGASWDMMYAAAKQYYETHGNLEPTKYYKTPEGFSLGAWLNTQRRVRSGKISGALTDEQADKLTAIGMRWDNVSDLLWERNYAAAKAYYEEFGNLLVNVHNLYRGIRLGAWLSALRKFKKRGTVSDEHIAALDKIGMVWDVPDYLWERNFLAAVKYYGEHGNLDVPTYYVADGVRLGQWLGRIRSARLGSNSRSRVTDEQAARLDALGMRWDDKFEADWESAFEALCRYKAEHGNFNIKKTYRTEDGFALAAWLRRQRNERASLSAERREKLNAIGALDTTDPWNDKFELLKGYIAEHGSADMPYDLVVNGVWLRAWLQKQLIRLNGADKSGRTLTKAQKEKLLSLGIKPDESKIEDAWMSQYEDVKDFFEKNGHLQIHSDYIGPKGRRTGIWIRRQRENYASGVLTKKHLALLNAIDESWIGAAPFDMGYEHAVSYYNEHGDINVSGDFTCDDGYRLGYWISRQRKMYKEAKSSLTDEQIEKLNKLGMIWNAVDYRWNLAYEQVKAYREQYGNLNIPNRYVNESGVNLHAWLYSQRVNYHSHILSTDKIALLNDLGMDWRFDKERRWDNGFEHAKKYYRKHRNLYFASDYVDEDGFTLGRWVRTQRERRKNLTSTQIKLLNAVGMVWNVSDIPAYDDRKAKRQVV